MRCTVLASGSKGNCVYLAGRSNALLIDAGLSAKETLSRMTQAGCDPDIIEAIIVSHEHTDHIRGVDVLSRKLDCPIYSTQGTLKEFVENRKTSKGSIPIHTCHYDQTFTITDFAITPFATSHDATEPCGFVIKEEGNIIGYCTDTGVVNSHMISLLRKCDGIVLESNHCPKMLAEGPYPESLKRRIRSNRGHLSNPASAKILQVFGKDVGHVILAHLSEINNTPERALASAREGLGLFFEEKSVCVATQKGSTAETPVEIRL